MTHFVTQLKGHSRPLATNQQGFPSGMVWFSGLILLLGLVLGASPLQAGEKLNIFGAKTRLQPGSEKNAGSKREDALSNLSQTQSPYGTPRRKPRPRSAKLERQLQNARDEAENWALLEPGQLQEDQEKGASRNSRPSRDYLFYGMDKANSGQNPRNGEGNEAKQAQAQVQAQAARAYQQENNSSTESRRIQLNPFASQTATDEPNLGAHMASGLNFRSLVDPQQTTAGVTADAPGDNRNSDISLRELIGSSRMNFPSTKSGEMEGTSQRLISYSLRPGSLSGSSPINQTPDRTSDPVNPVTAPSRISTPGSLLGGSMSASQNPNSLRGGRGFPDSQSALRQPGISGFSTMPSPTLQSRNPTLMEDLSNPGFNSPKRKF